MNQILQDLKVEIESSQTVGNQEIKSLGTQIGTIEASFTTEYKRWKKQSQASKTSANTLSFKKKLNLKSPCTKHLGNLEHQEKTISTNNKNRGRRKNIGKGNRKYF